MLFHPWLFICWLLILRIIWKCFGFGQCNCLDLITLQTLARLGKCNCWTFLVILFQWHIYYCEHCKCPQQPVWYYSESKASSIVSHMSSHVLQLCASWLLCLVSFVCFCHWRILDLWEVFSSMTPISDMRDNMIHEKVMKVREHAWNVCEWYLTTKNKTIDFKL
jgi:hypothetical protein